MCATFGSSCMCTHLLFTNASYNDPCVRSLIECSNESLFITATPYRFISTIRYTILIADIMVKTGSCRTNGH